MKNDLIRNAMNTVTPTPDQKARMRDAIRERLPMEAPSSGRYQQKHKPARRFGWIPAVAALLAVVTVGGFMLGRHFGSTRTLSPGQVTEPTEQADPVQEFYTSAQYQAIVEWQDYLAEHGRSHGDTSGSWYYPYGLFGCEDEQMQAALDALCEKHGLSLQTDGGGTDSIDYLQEVMGLKAFFRNLPGVESGLVYGAGGWIYPDGSVEMFLSTTMSYSGSPWTESVIYSLSIIKKQSFFSCLLPLGVPEEYDRWEYTTQSGVTLLLGRKEDDAFLFTPGKTSVVYVDIGDFTEDEGINGITREGMEALAETIDFAALTGAEEPGTLENLLLLPQYQANVEWNAYLQTAEGGNQGLIAPYPDYGCTNDTMARKLDALCDTYGLSLTEYPNVMDDYYKLLDMVGVDTICKIGEDVTYRCSDHSFTYYPEGSFTFGGSITMTAGDCPWQYPVEFTFSRIMKNIFHPDLLEIGDISRYETWEASTSEGVEVLLAMDADKALILVPREKDLLLVITRSNRVGDTVSGEQSMDKAALEAFAGTFDFTLPPDGGLAPLPEQRAVAKEQLDVYSMPSSNATVVSRIPAGTELQLLRREWINGIEWAFLESGWIDLNKVEITYGEQAPESAAQEYDPALYRYDYILEKYVTAISEGWDAARCSQEDISILVSFLESPDSLGYALTDLDGNGNKELIITDGNVIYDLYTLLDDGPGHILMGWERNTYFLCDGNLLKNTGSNGAASSFTAFFRLDGIDLRYEETVQYAADVDPENPWFLQTGSSGDLTPITEEEANNILDSHAVLAIETRPLKDHP